MSFNIFPARIEIGQFEVPGQKSTKVYMSPEFARSLASLFEMLGGANGFDSNSLAILASFTPEPALVPASADATALTAAGAEISALRDALAQTQAQLDASRADLAPLARRVEALEVLRDFSGPASAAPLERRVEALEMQIQPAPVGADWEHPGRIGAKTPNAANFTAIGASGQITSTVAGGTAPFVVASSTVVGNLNVSQLLGGTWAVPGAIGSTTRNTGAFTTLTTTGSATIGTGAAAVSVGINGTNAGVGGGAVCVVSNAGAPVIAIGNRSAIFGGAYDALPVIYCPTGPVRLNVGFQVDVGFGCNGKTPQVAAASGGAMATTAATNAAPFGFTTAAQADSIAVKLNTIQSALIANGIMS